MSRSRAYVFTVNNWTESDYAAVRKLAEEAQYLVVGKEVGASGTPHLQGYVYFSSQRHMSAVSKALPRAHLEPAKAGADANQAYCSKGGDVEAWGERPRQGRRSDLDLVRKGLDAGHNMRAIIDYAPSFQAVRFAEVAMKFKEPERAWKPEVRWYWGPTGSGKTSAAVEWLGSGHYSCGTSIKWWEGYDAHEAVLIDEFRDTWCILPDLLRLLDRFPMRVEVKGSSRQFLARRIAITCPYHPSQLYGSSGEDIKQLLRRIEEIIFLS